MRHRTDTTQKDIVSALRKAGAFVWIIGRPVDLLIHYRERWTLMECKTKGWNSKDKRMVEQRAFVKDFAVPVVETVEEALEAIGLTRAAAVNMAYPAYFIRDHVILEQDC